MVYHSINDKDIPSYYCTWYPVLHLWDLQHVKSIWSHKCFAVLYHDVFLILTFLFPSGWHHIEDGSLLSPASAAPILFISIRLIVLKLSGSKASIQPLEKTWFLGLWQVTENTFLVKLRFLTNVVLYDVRWKSRSVPAPVLWFSPSRQLGTTHSSTLPAWDGGENQGGKSVRTHGLR